MKTKIAIFTAFIVGAIAACMIMPSEAEATGGLFSRRRVVQRQRVVVRPQVQRVVKQQVVQQNKVVERVIVNNGHYGYGGQQIIQRNVIAVPQRTLRIVEVPQVQLQRSYVIQRNQVGNVLNVQRRNVVEIQKQKVRGNKIIVEQNVIKGY